MFTNFAVIKSKKKKRKENRKNAIISNIGGRHTGFWTVVLNLLSTLNLMSQRCPVLYKTKRKNPVYTILPKRENSYRNHIFVAGCLYVYFCCKVGHFAFEL